MLVFIANLCELILSLVTVNFHSVSEARTSGILVCSSVCVALLFGSRGTALKAKVHDTFACRLMVGLTSLVTGLYPQFGKDGISPLMLLRYVGAICGVVYSLV